MHWAGRANDKKKVALIGLGERPELPFLGHQAGQACCLLNEGGWLHCRLHVHQSSRPCAVYTELQEKKPWQNDVGAWPTCISATCLKNLLSSCSVLCKACTTMSSIARSSLWFTISLAWWSNVFAAAPCHSREHSVSWPLHCAVLSSCFKGGPTDVRPRGELT